MSEQTQALAHRTPVGMGLRGVELRSIEDAYRFAHAVVKSGLAPKGDTPETVLVKLQAGMELGLAPMRAMQSLVAVGGRLSMMGNLALGLVRNSGLLVKGTDIRVVFEGKPYDDDYVCVVTSQRVNSGEPFEARFSVGDAKRARLWMRKGRDGQDTPWVTFPDRMLRWRALGHHLTDYYSDVLMGLLVREASDELEEIKDATVGLVPKTRAGRSFAAAAPPKLDGPDPLFGHEPVKVEAEVDVDFSEPPEQVDAERRAEYAERRAEYEALLAEEREAEARRGERSLF